MDAEELYLPFSTAIGRQMRQFGTIAVFGPTSRMGGSSKLRLRVDTFWVELSSTGAISDYKQYLQAMRLSSALPGASIGRRWSKQYTAREWIGLVKVVSDEVKISTLIAFGFLIVCLLNAVGLLLARFSSRAGELGVRRALGASRWNVFCQCMTETMLVGALGALLGLGLTAIGQASERALEGGDSPLNRLLYSLDTGMVLITIAIAVVATMCAGLYPTWRASLVQPALQLKTD